jgi:hypothetical protein
MIVSLTEILVEILQGIGSLFIRSRSDIDRIEGQIARRQQHRRRR